MYRLYVSLWDEHEGAPGIALYELDEQNGETRFVRKLNDSISFGHSYVDKERNLIYLVNETEKVWGAPCETGRVMAYRIENDGNLTEFSSVMTMCGNPAYLALTKDRKYMIVSNYGVGGAIASLKRNESGEIETEFIHHKSYIQLYRMNEDGSIGELVDFTENKGKPEYMGGECHSHCCELSPDGRFFAVTDKGSGMLYLYSVDEEKGRIVLCDSCASEEGKASPRHCVFHPTAPILILNQEKEGRGKMMLDAFAYEGGKLRKVSSVNVLPAETEVPKGAHFEQQGLAISKDGKTVYTALKGPGQVAAVNVAADGQLSVLGYAPIKGVWPRGLAISPDGKYVTVTAHCSGELNVYKVREDNSLEVAMVIEGPVGGADMSFV